MKNGYANLRVTLILSLLMLIGELGAQYCLPTYTNVCFNPVSTPGNPAITDDNINNFWTTGAVTNISNMNTGCNGVLPNNHTFFSSMMLTVNAGSTFTANVQCNPGQVAGQSFAQGFKIWIDWNQDGVFDNSTTGTACAELGYNSSTSGFQVFTTTITVPPTALPGVTRMRVRSSFAGVPTGPCTNETYGECEDYPVTVIANPNNPGMISANGVTICAGQTATLTATGGGIIRWYATQTSASFIGIGPNYTTPVLNTTTTYWVQTTINGCPSPRIPVTVTVIPPFTVSPTASAATVCAGNPVTLTGPAGYASYAWSPAAGFANATTNPATATLAAATTFTLTVTDANGCSGTGTVNVGLDAAPPLNISATATSVCPGAPVTLTASGSTSAYNWLATTGFAATTGATVTVNPTATTTYTVTSTSATGTCPATASQVITVNPLPAADAGAPLTLCAGSTGTLNANGGATYAWTPTGGLSNPNVANPVVSATSSTLYHVTVTSAQGCVAHDSVQVTINALPIANPGPGAANCSGTGAQLNGSGGVGYQWSPATGLSSASIANPVATPNTSTNYTLTVTDANGCVSAPSAPVTVTVFNQPAAPTISVNGPITFCQGGSVQLNVSGGVSYLWSNGQTGSSLTVTASGNYSATLTDANGCTSPSSEAIPVNVTPGPPAPVITPSGATSFCQGGNVTLTASTSSGYSWSNNATTQAITATSSGNYTVTISDANGCQSTSTPVAVTVWSLPATPSITAQSAPSFCPGGSVVLQAPNATSWLWSTNAVTQSISVNQTGSYTVTVTDANGCQSAPSAPFNTTLFPQPAVPVITAAGPTSFCQGNQVQLSTGAAQSYVWSNGALTQNQSLSASGTFTVSIIDFNGCPSAVSAPVNVTVWPLPAPPVISAVGTLTFCEGGSVELQAVPTTNINWSNGATGGLIEVFSTGQYTATTSDANGCISYNSNPLQVNVIPESTQPSITASGPTDICMGDTVTLTSSLAATYLWSNGATTRSIPVVQSGNYTVTVTSPCPGSNMTANISVQVRPLPVPGIQTEVTSVCIPDPVNFSASTAGIGPFAYSWTFSNGTQSTQPSPTLYFSQPGLIDVTLTLTDVIGCTGTSSATDLVEVLPRANLSYLISPKSTTLTNPEITFTGLTPNAQSHHWEIESVGEFDDVMVVHSFQDTGHFLVRYTVVTESGCEATRKDTVHVYDDFALYIPNAFSPNEDGLNEVFMPVCSGFMNEDFQFEIYNRWGERIFATSEMGKGWDGQKAPQGVYTWVLNGKSRLDEEFRYFKGHFNLIR